MAWLSEADETFFGGGASGGKEAPLDSKVLTPFGFVEMGSLKVGTNICATDGTVTSVIGIYPQGVKPIYRVTMADGGSTECGLDHLWLAWRHGESRKIDRQEVCGLLSARKYTTSDLISRMGKGHSFSVPVPEPVKFNVAGCLRGRGNFIGRPVDPYLLGLLLGDGCMTGTAAVSLCSADQEIIDHVLGAFKDDICLARRDGSATMIWRGESRKILESNLAKLGLMGSRAINKHIPSHYLHAPVEDRWQLLRGLMDTDGWAEEGRAVYFTTISQRLCDDVAYLARSLGAVVTVTDKLPTYTLGGAKLSGQPARCVRMRFPCPEMAFRLSRKRATASTIHHRSEGRRIASIEFSRMAEAQCIHVAHPNSLYIADDFIVTHNSFALLGLAMTAHSRVLILRQEATQLKQLKDDLIGMTQPGDHWRQVGYGGILDTADGRMIELSGCASIKEAEKYRGRAHDAKFFDELVGGFAEDTYRLVGAWCRTNDPKQKCRIVATGNPPTKPEDEWVIRYWGAWLDQRNSNPAEPGELRWYVSTRDGYKEVESGSPIEIDGEICHPRSRTFIPARLSDNPILEATGYRATLQGLREPLRSQLLYGDMSVGRADDDWQLIPTSWVRAAIERWNAKGHLEPDGRTIRRMTCAALDCALEGADRMALAKRYDDWVGPIITWPGTSIHSGDDIVRLVFPHLEILQMPLLVDVLATAGGAAVTALKSKLPKLPVVPVNFGVRSTYKDKTGRLEMANLRAEAYWRLQEALDPAKGGKLALPDDAELLTEICAVRWQPRSGKVQLEPKDKIKERIGRSPDKADAVAMAMLGGKPRDGGWVPIEKAAPVGSDWVTEVLKMDVGTSDAYGTSPSRSFMGIG